MRLKMKTEWINDVGGCKGGSNNSSDRRGQNQLSHPLDSDVSTV